MRAGSVAGRGSSWDGHLPAGDGPALADQAADILDELAPFGVLDAFGQGLFGVVVEDRYRDLRDDRPGVHTGIDEEERGTGELHAVGERVARPVDAGERWQQRVVRVDVPVADGTQEGRPDKLE